MTLIKSLLLGSAAGIVAIASAQAADLPTKKGAPAAEYVKVCSVTVNGTPIVGFVLPGSDTCLKISGYVSAQYTYGPARTAPQNAVGLFTRGQLNLEAASNTAMGPLYSMLQLQGDYGVGFDSRYGVGGANARTQINNAFIQWAGLTAGKHGSYFDFLAGGAAWDDIISPDHTGGPVNLLAYTATFGGGFSATVSMEAPEGTPNAIQVNGNRSPDFVAQLAVSQGWGGAQLSGVLHNSRGQNLPTLFPAAPGVLAADQWGYALLGGLKFNIPGMAGADIKLQGVYAHDAAGYSGMGSWGDFNFANVVGEGGSPMALNDYIQNPVTGAISHTTAWSVAGIVDLPISANFSIHPEASYGSFEYGNGVGKETAFLGGGVLEWVPVKNLTFDLDLLYVSGKYTAVLGAVPTTTNSFDGFNAKLRIERDF